VPKSGARTSLLAIIVRSISTKQRSSKDKRINKDHRQVSEDMDPVGERPDGLFYYETHYVLGVQPKESFDRRRLWIISSLIKEIQISFGMRRTGSRSVRNATTSRLQPRTVVSVDR